jgi:hypothetical protein
MDVAGLNDPKLFGNLLVSPTNSHCTWQEHSEKCVGYSIILLGLKEGWVGRVIEIVHLEKGARDGSQRRSNKVDVGFSR